MAGLNAAFLDIGTRKDAFLHYTDLGPKLPSVIEYTKEILNKNPGYSIHNMDLSKEIHKNGKIQDVMDKRTMMLVQILKEPISTKGQLLIESIKPKNFGIIARTAAEGRKVADLHDEINTLAQKWNDMEESLKEVTGPQKILSEADKTTSLIRDFMTNDYQHIVVNDKDLYNNVRSFMTAHRCQQRS